MKIFTYIELKNKAEREIERLIKSELILDQEASIDHALNAAFTIYHLIQWRQDKQNSEIKIKVYDFIMSTKNQGLKVLHNVVTCNKHVSVTTKAYFAETDPRLENNIGNILTEDGHIMTTEDDVCFVTEESNIKVYFGDLEAVTVLKGALREFA
ncbi:hypothetical protein TUM19329_01760 [Legionella antarctica]|uniref:Uncharacterized protein n=1 Tax=Legionella antarctica TaxID=2708020 RepID=A0A6F8SZI8_9GAMM|nr:hypothetical protein [Legionella antarctica]BCA93815.1 hypothetical protein TUM19329_01760 [Legionella antarctica]